MIKVSELFLVCGLVGVLPFAANKFSQEPDGFIPMWSLQKGKRHQTALLNTRQIVRITPVFDPDLVLSRTRNPKSDYLEVLLSTGELLIVDEEYDDFKKRVRNSR
tara:strand:- start:3017 stop:3331 length:315 start_codon:yes stop_codon:yes gene_type:complete